MPTRTLTQRALAAPLTVLALGLGVAACGDDDVDGRASPGPAGSAQPPPVLSFASPPPASPPGNVATFEVAANGIGIVAADGDTSGATGHFHVFVDRPLPGPGEVISSDPGIIHTTDGRVTLSGLTRGRHHVAVVLGDGTHRRIGSHVVETDVTVEGPSVVLSAPASVAAGETVTVEARVDGLRLTAADGDRSGQSGHLHYFVDRAPTPAGQPIPREDGIIHTTETQVSIPGLLPGVHTIWVVAGDGVHVPLGGPVMAKTTFVVRAEDAS
jgi:hypothetical protein